LVDVAVARALALEDETIVVSRLDLDRCREGKAGGHERSEDGFGEHVNGDCKFD
jgi:hypothetical protein